MKNPLNQKEILQQLSKEFDQEYWKRGQEYYREGLVKEVKQNKTNTKTQLTKKQIQFYQRSLH